MDAIVQHSLFDLSEYNCLSPVFREKYYGYEPDVIEPAEIDPDSHTMKRENFMAYIGRRNVEGYGIDCKKLSPQQITLVRYAYEQSLIIRVMGVLRKDADVVATLNGYELEHPAALFEREDKVFNCYRQSMCIARSVSDNDTRELWVFVFPSQQYVDQVAELLNAIIDDYKRCKLGPSSTQVICWHFSKFEEDLTRWTGFDEAVRRYVRDGDVVAIGNLEHFIPGLMDIGFQATEAAWRFFGLDDMFGAKCFVNKSSMSRIVLIGFKECFWGDASAKYVREIINAGARHILYGSKAASLLKETVHDILSPVSFFNINEHVTSASPIEHVGTHFSDLHSILELFSIDRGCSAVTVPTVIGETNAQRVKYNKKSPACLDCETGHIAEVVQEINGDMASVSSGGEDFVKFVPVHFITDYIYRPEEEYDQSKPGLGSKDRKDEVNEKKVDCFSRIGRLFGLYALYFGNKEYLRFPDGFTRRTHSSDDVEAIVSGVKPLIDAGLGHQAIASILSLHPNSVLPTNVLIATMMVAQKCGFIEFFDIARAELKIRKLSEIDKFRVNVLELKVLSQCGNFCAAVSLAKQLRGKESAQFVATVNQYGAIERRLAVASAAVGDLETFKDAVHAARANIPPERADHYIQTNQLFELIGQFHLFLSESDFPLTEVSNTLSNVRREYLKQVNSDPKWWQLNLEKCSIAALFLEAAYLLDYGSRLQQTAGLKRLYAAHLMNNRFGGNECSETYGEILCAVKSIKVRAMIALAMGRDAECQIEFLEIMKQEQTWLDGTAETAIALLRSLPANREDALQNLLLWKPK